MFQRISLEIVAKKFEKIFTVDLTLTTYCQINCEYFVNKFLFSKKATKIDEIFTVDLTVDSKCQIDGEDFVIYVAFLENMNFKIH